MAMETHAKNGKQLTARYSPEDIEEPSEFDDVEDGRCTEFLVEPRRGGNPKPLKFE